MDRTISALDVPAAGAKAAIGEGKTAHCLKYDLPPPTPHNVKKYRKTFFNEPGGRVIHPGLIDDVVARKERFANTTFGNVSEGANMTVSDVFAHGPQTKMADYLNERKEQIYKSRKNEQLGKPQTYGTQFPDRVADPNFRFGGAKPRGKHADLSAKDLIYPVPQKEDARSRELYIKSHGLYEPGEQRRSGIDVGFDVHRHRFGKVGSSGERNGVGNCLSGGTNSEDIAAASASRGSVLHIVPKQLVRYKEVNTDELGKCKNLGQGGSDRPGQDFAYGVSSAAADSWGAKDCIQGAYSEADQQPDPDLGKAIAPGWRNDTNTNRTFGCPTIRTDIKPPKKRSVGDSQNYGDDTNAQALLHPAQYAGMGIEDRDFLEDREQSDLRQLFASAGISMSDEVFERIYARAKQIAGAVSIEVLRRVYNEYDDAVHQNTVPRWW